MASAAVEPPLGYHPGCSELLTGGRDPALGQCQVGSLTGAVASEKVTEVPKGTLRRNGNPPNECKGRRVLDSETDKSS